MFVLLFTVYLCRHTCQHLASGYAHHLRHQTDIRLAHLAASLILTLRLHSSSSCISVSIITFCFFLFVCIYFHNIIRCFLQFPLPALSVVSVVKADSSFSVLPEQAMQPPVCHCLPPQCLPAETIGSLGALSRLGEACCALYERGQCYVLMKSV